MNEESSINPIIKKMEEKKIQIETTNVSILS